MRLLFDGHACFRAYLDALEGATKRIWICVYIIRNDDYTRQLFDLLQRKHEEGVEVLVWYDAYGCLSAIPWLITRPFTKMFVPRWYRLGTRNHAKIILIDDALAIISGRNFTKNYFEHWVDASIFFTDKTHVRQIQQFRKRIEQQPVPGPSHTGLFRYTDPLTHHRSVYHFILEHIVLAKRTITIASPYFIIDDAVEELLLAAAERGVKITVIVPSKPQHRLAATFNRINFQRIHHKNVTVMRSKGMFHSKVMLFDNTALVGSANFDNRSFKYNFELSAVLGGTHIAAIKKHLKEVADHSVSYNWVQRQYDALLYHLTRHLMEFM